VGEESGRRRRTALSTGLESSDGVVLRTNGGEAGGNRPVTSRNQVGEGAVVVQVRVATLVRPERVVDELFGGEKGGRREEMSVIVVLSAFSSFRELSRSRRASKHEKEKTHLGSLPGEVNVEAALSTAVLALVVVASPLALVSRLDELGVRDRVGTPCER
jgi:hypothetical protein